MSSISLIESGSEFEESEDSEMENFIEVEDQDPTAVEISQHECHEDELENKTAYDEEPLADAEWLAQYEKELEETKELEKSLSNRLNGTEPVREWCKCGNCNREYLQNLSECYCCSELEGCTEAMTCDIVAQDLAPGQVLTCITDHPGFNPVCLQKWSLRLAAGKYNTKEKKRYHKTGSEERFLRSVSYREFSRLVYNFLGNKRIPLPACAYTAIRKEFPAKKDEDFEGFELDDE